MTGPSTEAEIGRITIDLSRSIEDQEMLCPMMIWGGEAQIRPTMSLRQCVDRIGLRNPCVRHCKVIKEKLAEMGTDRKEVEQIWAKFNPRG